MAASQQVPTPAEASAQLALAREATRRPAVASDERGSQRDMQRAEARDYYRSMARVEPVPDGHLKYHIHREDFVPDCDHEWVPVRVNGLDSGQLRRSMGHGWVPARACDFPQLSGYGVEYSDNLRRAGYVPNVQADDPIEIDGQMLMIRAAELSKRAEVDRLKAAQDQVDTQMRRLEMISRKKIGDRTGRGGTEVRYGRTRQYVNTELDEAFKSEGEV